MKIGNSARCCKSVFGLSISHCPAHLDGKATGSGESEDLPVKVNQLQAFGNKGDAKRGNYASFLAKVVQHCFIRHNQSMVVREKQML